MRARYSKNFSTDATGACPCTRVRLVRARDFLSEEIL